MYSLARTALSCRWLSDSDARGNRTFDRWRRRRRKKVVLTVSQSSYYHMKNLCSNFSRWLRLSHTVVMVRVREIETERKWERVAADQWGSQVRNESAASWQIERNIRHDRNFSNEVFMAFIWHLATLWRKPIIIALLVKHLFLEIVFDEVGNIPLQNGIIRIYKALQLHGWWAARMYCHPVFLPVLCTLRLPTTTLIEIYCTLPDMKPLFRFSKIIANCLPKIEFEEEEVFTIHKNMPIQRLGSN